ncbi:archaetidylserine decarboxylase [Neochlamydia sp. S13]|uniref:archaetidylserine decarboxylase n=1 Tax=Neochlamydia sp. S13 TaxID=1353976 RepID=UPI0005A97215|nr:archaetidylserine decarboxylase [Neochlamydia sp. S13]BBI17951.1 Putative phosphatidylserine decarboxylase proenzyme [Neochlamydia sp. S13]
MDIIYYLDRKNGKREIEKVYGARALKLLYGHDWISKLVGPVLLHSLVKYSFFSAWYGKWQASVKSKNKIEPFIREFGLDPLEFLEEVSYFKSFNDFFIRKLKPTARPLASGEDVAIIPADGRYLFYSDLSQVDGFIVKGEKFDLTSLLDDADLAAHYAKGAMAIARLCPTDYHRYHFPCDCVAGKTKIINGWLYSVNPAALKKDIHIFTKNKRTLCKLATSSFGCILFLEIGATNVGSIHETYQPDVLQKKGDEKGYFSFGGSSLILLFEPGKIQFDQDLLAASRQGLEIKCLMGQSMGKALS